MKPSDIQPAISFDQNRLTGRSRLSTIVLKGWPTPEAWRQFPRQKQWCPDHPGLNITDCEIEIGPLICPGTDKATLEIQKLRACTQYCSQIPNPVRKAIAPFPAGGYQTIGQWDMLRFAARFGQSGMDLIASTSALAFLLAANGIDGVTLNASQPQIELLRGLGFPARKSIIKLLRKIPCQDLDLGLLDRLRQNIRNQTILHPLQHVSQITYPVLDLVLDDALRPCVTVSFLEEVSSGHHHQAALWVRHVLSLAETINRPADQFSFSSLSDLWTCQDDLTRTLGKLRQHRLAQTLIAGGQPVFVTPGRRRQPVRRTIRTRPDPFTPPLPGTETIAPLTSALMIRAWASEMRNCMAARISRVGQDYYLYKITAPEKAALAIAKRNNKWAIAELKGVCNRPVKKQTRDLVTRWLHDAGF